MDISGLKRNPGKVKATLKQVNDGSVKTLKGCKLYVPTRYQDGHLLSISDSIETTAIFAIVVGNDYAVSLANTMIILGKAGINKVVIDGEEYFEFSYEPGDTLFKSTTLLKRDILVYRIFDNFISKGNIPWFISYVDLASIFDTAYRMAGANLSANHAIFEMITSSIARDNRKRNQYYRQTARTTEYFVSTPPVIIPLRSVQWGATNTTAKLMGAYFDTGLSSALVNPSTRPEKIEELLRQ